MEYALVNIVMGDIADIEKKKSMGISNLILGTRGIPIRRNEKDGAIETEVRREGTDQGFKLGLLYLGKLIWTIHKI